MFKRGILKGSNPLIPVGGHCKPISIVEDSLEWKKVQKKEMKKKISETINKIIPSFNPIKTCFKCNPWKVASRDTSRHHWNIVNKIIINPIKNIKLIFFENSFTILVKKIKVPIDPIKGQGL